MNLALLKQLPTCYDFDFYLCGPQLLMQSLCDGLTATGILPERIHYESFGPATVLEQTTTLSTPKATETMASGPVKVRFAKSRDRY